MPCLLLSLLISLTNIESRTQNTDSLEGLRCRRLKQQSCQHWRRCCRQLSRYSACGASGVGTPLLASAQSAAPAPSTGAGALQMPVACTTLMQADAHLEHAAVHTSRGMSGPSKLRAASTIGIKENWSAGLHAGKRQRALPLTVDYLHAHRATGS